ncbi:MAG: nitroreductase [Magnetococcales bacterium]|nr:nitroreductase [Magnetococcales bacterium]
MKRVLAYHEQSKHHPQRLAPGPGHLDWAHQPEPFRTYEGAPHWQLPLVADSLTTRFADLYLPVGKLPMVAMNRVGVGALLELSLGLSAWKVHGQTRWPLRCNPSSGNLHPTEGYLLLPRMSDLPSGVYHYVSRDHLLEQRCPVADGDQERWRGLFPPHTILMGLTSIHWREAWKYGLRAWRYCQLDVGHAVAAVRHAAAVLGWRAQLLTAPATGEIARLLGVHNAGNGHHHHGSDRNGEREHPDCLLQISLPVETPEADMGENIAALAELVASGPWQGVANRLSERHAHQWPGIDEIAALVEQPARVVVPRDRPVPWPKLLASSSGVKAADLIRQRRSGQSYDDMAWLDRHHFFRMLDATLPRAGCAPWDALPWRPRIHPVLLVHRVRDLPTGLYLLLRHPDARQPLQQAMHSGFVWSPLPEAPAHLPLFLLQEGSFQDLAQRLSCQQEIAARGVFTLGMLAEFTSDRSSGPWDYPRLYWEAGMVGQTLYLEAEVAGMRGTGIGCFFDDFFHQMLGLQDATFQSLYHFTVGLPILDQRLRTESPYRL